MNRSARSELSFTISVAPTSFDENVDIALSRQCGAGTGLFATQDIAKGAPVASYYGDLLHMTEWKLQDGSNKDYGLSVPHDLAGRSDYVVDSYINFGQSMGRFVNEGSIISENNVHAKWHSTSSTSGFIYFQAKKEISMGDEILCDYGAGYPRPWLS